MASDSLIKKQIKQFIEERTWKWYEKWQSQPFWIDLLSKVLWVENPTQFIEFEDHVKIDKANWFIDWFIPSTKVLIEQKWDNKDLRAPIKQSDWSLLNPFQQAKRYSAELPYDKKPRWIITCNFKSFLVYDMNNPNWEPEEILLKNLAKEYYRLSFIVNEKAEHIKKEEEISFKAWELIGKIYDAFAKQYKDIENEDSQKSLNELCVRLVFCLYAEDAGIFGKKDMFHDYLIKYSNDLDVMRKALIELFKVLDTNDEERKKLYLSDELEQFPYVNWWLFSNENIEIPKFTEEIKNLILVEASDNFDWSDISPTIFWAVFESTLNPETRRKWGMHYTSIENIHKVIDPLFLDELRTNLDETLSIKYENPRRAALVDFQNKLASLKFFDPACWSGNFLTETYLSLRRLENEAIRAFGWATLNPDWIVKVHINQFYGIEINDFAVKVATTALWIAESQTVKETEEIIWTNINFLPLKTYTNIKEWNALRINRNEVISNKECNYIMWNPPFVWARLMETSQKNEINEIFKWIKNAWNLDYVAWRYKLATNYMKWTKIQTALVSTNSITQWEQVWILRKELFEEWITINFAHRTFRRDSESNLKANVFCVIIWFSFVEDKEQYIYDNWKIKQAKNINWYLIDWPLIVVESRTKPICEVNKMDFWSMPNDDGFLSNYTKEEKENICKRYPKAEALFKRILWAEEFINDKERYCLRLDWISPTEYKDIPPIMEAIQNVKNVRELSKREATKKLAKTPYLFWEIRHPDSDYLLIPSATSSNRKYIPIWFFTKDIISTNLNLLVSNANLYDFWILTSNVHNARMRAVCGRLWNWYRYSAKIVYNNFPRPTPTADQKRKIEQTAQAILDARKLYPDCSLGDLYDELTMPVELRKAHQNNDRAVMEAYGFSTKMTESECVAKLMEMYEKLVSN